MRAISLALSAGNRTFGQFSRIEQACKNRAEAVLQVEGPRGLLNSVLREEGS